MKDVKAGNWLGGIADNDLFNVMAAKQQYYLKNKKR